MSTLATFVFDVCDVSNVLRVAIGETHPNYADRDRKLINAAITFMRLNRRAFAKRYQEPIDPVMRRTLVEELRTERTPSLLDAVQSLTLYGDNLDRYEDTPVAARALYRLQSGVLRAVKERLEMSHWIRRGNRSIYLFDSPGSDRPSAAAWEDGEGQPRWSYVFDWEAKRNDKVMEWLDGAKTGPGV